MIRVAVAMLMVLISIAAAHAFGLGKLGFQFGHLGGLGGKAVVVPPLTNLRITNTGDFRITSSGANRAVSP